MPPFSRTIEEEGALFECFALVSAGSLRESEVARRAHRRPEWPDTQARGKNLADLRAQTGRQRARASPKIGRAVRRHGLDTMRAYMRHVQDNAAQCVRNAIGRLQPGSFRYEMDGGS